RRRRGIGARQQEAAVRVVGAAGPDLLAVQHPLAVPAHGACLQVVEVAAGVGLAEALAEDQLAGEDLLQVSLLLPVAAVHAEERRQQRDAEASDYRRGAGAHHLRLIDGLHDGRRAAAAALLGPGQRQPAALVETPLPVALDALFLFFAIPADA